MSSFIPLSRDKDFPDVEQEKAMSQIFVSLISLGITKWEDVIRYMSEALVVNPYYLKELMWRLLDQGEIELSGDRTRVEIFRSKAKTA